MHLSLFSTSYLAFSRAAGQHRISPQLPCSHIDFRSRLNYFGMQPITQVLRFAVFTHVPTPPLKLLFHRIGLFCRHPFVHLVCFASIMDLFFFLLLWNAEPECLCARERERVHIMNNSWCGFLVSQTDRR